MNIDEYMESFAYNTENPPEYCEYTENTMMEWIFRRKKYSIFYNFLKVSKLDTFINNSMNKITLLLCSDNVLSKYKKNFNDYNMTKIIKNHIVLQPLSKKQLSEIHINIFETLNDPVFFENNMGILMIEHLNIDRLSQQYIGNSVIYDINGLIKFHN